MTKNNGVAIVAGLVSFIVITIALSVPYGVLIGALAGIGGFIVTAAGAAGAAASIDSARTARKQLDAMERQEKRGQVEEQRRAIIDRPSLTMEAAWTPKQPRLISLMITNHGAGMAKSVRLILDAKGGNTRTEDLGSLGPGHTITRVETIALNGDYSTPTNAPGYVITAEYDGEESAGGRTVLRMYQEHPPAWKPDQSAAVEPQLLVSQKQ